MVYWDIETTGFAPPKDEITQVSAIRTVRNGVIEQFDQYVRINGSVSAKITELTGITNELLQEKGRPVENVLRDFKEFVGNDTMVAHNGKPFDSRFVNFYCPGDVSFAENPKIDSLVLAKKVVGNRSRHKLGDLVQFFGCSTHQAHNALGDSMMLKEMYENLSAMAHPYQIQDAMYK